MSYHTLETEYRSAGISYTEYRRLIDTLLAEGTTTNGDSRPDILDYTKMNVQRMNRLDKTVVLLPEFEVFETLLAQKNTQWLWLILTEGWCGDAAQIIPVIEKIAAQNAHIETRYLMRDANESLMNRYLTNGVSKAIPKLVCVRKADWAEIGSWGARPRGAQALVEDYKNNPVGDFKALAEKLHGWYAKDKTLSTQRELLAAMQAWLEA
jgi:hypothetical protein